MRAALDDGTLIREMIARAVDDAESRLRDLRHEEWEEATVAAAAFVLALVATSVRPNLALPLFLGAVFVTGRWVIALLRRAELLDLLAGDRDAYAIPEVRAHAAREASMEARRSLSRTITVRLEAENPRLARAADDLAALAAELVDPELELDPACAVACARLLADPVINPLPNEQLPADEIRSRVLQVRAGFHPHGRDPHPS